MTTLWEQTQVDLCEFKVILVYKVSSRSTKDSQSDLVSNKQQQNKWGLKEVSNPLELELQVVVSHHVGAGN